MRCFTYFILLVLNYSCFSQDNLQDSHKLLVNNGKLLIVKGKEVIDTIVHHGFGSKVVDYRFYTNDRIDIVLVDQSMVYYDQSLKIKGRWVPGPRSNVVFWFKSSCRDENDERLCFSRLDQDYLFKIEDEFQISYLYDGDKRYANVPKKPDYDKIMKLMNIKKQFKE